MHNEVIKGTPLYMNEPEMALSFLVAELGFVIAGDTHTKNREEVMVYDSHGNVYEILPSGRNSAIDKNRVGIVINTSDCLRDFYIISPKGLSILSKPHYAPEGLAFEILDYWDNKYTFLEKRDYED